MSFKKLFSIKKTEKIPGFFRKEIRIFGIKFSYHTYNISSILMFNYKYNSNLVCIAYHSLENSHEDDLFMLRNNTVCFIFNKKVLDFGYTDFNNYILNCCCVYANSFEFSKLDKRSSLYKEHLSRLNKNEFLWKYRDTKLIKHQFISFDENGFYIHDAVVNADDQSVPYIPNVVFQAKNSRRPYYNGPMVKEYLQDKNYDTQKSVLISLLDNIFENYSLENGMIDGKLYDCHWRNFIYDTNGQFHFIDDDFVSQTPLSKEYVIKKMLENEKCPLMNDLLIHFGFDPMPLHKNNKKAAKKNDDDVLSITEQLKNQYFIKY